MNYCFDFFPFHHFRNFNDERLWQQQSVFLLLLIFNPKLNLYLQTRWYTFDEARTSVKNILRFITNDFHIEIPIFQSLTFRLFIQLPYNLSIWDINKIQAIWALFQKLWGMIHKSIVIGLFLKGQAIKRRSKLLLFLWNISEEEFILHILGQGKLIGKKWLKFFFFSHAFQTLCSNFSHSWKKLVDPFVFGALQIFYHPFGFIYLELL